ncbi:hypothetical protein PCYB_145460 [Plasmodium cynomolgi strain B]|uniref:Uncharacterized protein n=1 Tax=Plasmodium cynomolgi (strain B) TaxID=1120755 RepID=K6UN32_PLACD|nr:hypothetical protein PCYB_145460 [Plasmodium cynomolgi strain B]GAB69118.1 hypothetical protein PCYB_145460 [Plasmodium cynomolgi strain B]
MNAVRKCPSGRGSSKSILFRTALPGGIPPRSIPQRKSGHPLIHHVRKSPFYTSVAVHNFDLRANEQLLLSNAITVNNETALLNGCLNFMKNFESFAAICCACSDPKNKLKKAIWFSSIGIEMSDFVQYCYEGDEGSQNGETKKILEEIVKSECPVVLRDRNSVRLDPDVAPKKVVNSAKRMRYFFNISEVHTCRGCYKKNRCKRFLQKYAGEPDFSDFTRLMTGFYNISKAYIRRNEVDRSELRHVVEKVNYFHCALFYVYNYLLKHRHFNYNAVEEGNRSAILTYLREKRRNLLLLKNQRQQEKVMNIPREYSDVIIPTDKAKMKKRQRNVFERLQRFRRRSQLAEDEEKFIWMEEQEEEDAQEKDPPADSYDQPLHNDSTRKNELNNELNNATDENSLVEIKDKNEPLSSFRFHYMTKMEKPGTSKEVCNYNKMYNKYSSLLQKKVCVNLDDQDVDEEIIKAESLLFKIPEAVGGYTFINYIESQPNNFILPINENLYKGIQVYKREELNLGDFWSNINNEELKIKRVGFYNPFNIKQNLEIAMQKKGAPPRSRSAQEKDEEIIDLSDDLSSFQEYLNTRKRAEGKSRRRERSHINLDDSPSYDASSPVVDPKSSDHFEDTNDEDARFAYFKKLRNERLNVDEHEEVKEEFNSVYNETYNAKGEPGEAYHHTHHIRRRLIDEEKGERGVTPEDIREERRRLLQAGRKELKEQSFYLFNNVKFPELPAELSSEEGLDPGDKRRKNLNDQLKKYIRPQSQKRNSNVPELTEETIEAHCSSAQGSRSLEIMLKKKRKHFKGGANVEEH